MRSVLGGARFLACALVLLGSLLMASMPSTAHAFHYFEHRWLGALACERLAAQLPNFSCSVQRGKLTGHWQNDQLDFGDMVALAGDHFVDPEALFKAVRDWTTGVDSWQSRKLDDIIVAREHQARGVRGWLSAGGLVDDDVLSACGSVAPWLYPTTSKAGDRNEAMTRCVEALGKAAHNAHAAAGIDVHESPDSNRAASCYDGGQYDEAQFVASPDYISNAASDQEHFGFRAEQSFRLYAVEAQALFQASTTWRTTIVDEAWVRAAFAMHFMTDRFAAGHMRTNPMGAAREVFREHGYDNRYGLRVQSWDTWQRHQDEAVTLPAPKHVWRAYGDMCLFSSAALVHRSVAAIATTIALSTLTRVPRSAPEPGFDNRVIGLPYVSPEARLWQQRRAVATGWSDFVDSVKDGLGLGTEPEDEINPSVPPAPMLLPTTFRGQLGGGVLVPDRDQGPVLGNAMARFDLTFDVFNVGNDIAWISGVAIGVRQDARGATTALLTLDSRLFPLGRLLAILPSFTVGAGSWVDNGAFVGLGVGMRLEVTPPGAFTISLGVNALVRVSGAEASRQRALFDGGPAIAVQLAN